MMNPKMILVAFYILSCSTATITARLLGGDLDQWGCKASAGYSWCEESQTCERWANCIGEQ